MSERFRKIDAAIKHCSGVVAKGGDCAADHQELLGWLVELRGRWEIENRGIEVANDRETEVGRLRAIFPQILKALDNGSGCLPIASVEFFEGIPAEVRAEVGQLRARVNTLEALAEEHRACLASYAEPGDPDYVPPPVPKRCMACGRYAPDGGEDWCHEKVVPQKPERRARIADDAVIHGPPPKDCPLRGGQG